MLCAARTVLVVTPNTPGSEVKADFQTIKVSYTDARHAYVIVHIITPITLTTQTALSCAVAITRGHEPPTHHECGNLRCDENQYLMNDMANVSLVLQMFLALKMFLVLKMNLVLSSYLMVKATATTI